MCGTVRVLGEAGRVAWACRNPGDVVSDLFKERCENSRVLYFQPLLITALVAHRHGKNVSVLVLPSNS